MGKKSRLKREKRKNKEDLVVRCGNNIMISYRHSRQFMDDIFYMLINYVKLGL